ncbi:MAG: hypothetical protein C4520_12980 [Candidatus Abyssobacteria bacterium SURF_5]|uniref:Uncharacterized protein n=1 Tax=Abyssobacteria bacterium (strain SURF_5) TaxID=2093360 RepID=A0A3A4NE24_ABYX5|nr:MAG: hypothetical protein C4520_12980 [Candidatus Abyssubacteria bacterium SURF_5]
MRLRRLARWYTLFLIIPTGAALCALGGDAILTESAKVKPYAVVFRDAKEARAARRKSDRLIIFLGDSSVAQPPWAEKGTPRTPALLESELSRSHPQLGTVSVLDWSFDGARFFHYFCLLFHALEYEPDLVIIPINWRNLGPSSWEQDPIYAFRELSRLVPLSERDRPASRRLFARENISGRAHLMHIARHPLLYLEGLRVWSRDRLGIRQTPDLENLQLPSVAEFMAGFSDRKLLEFYPPEISPQNPQVDTLRALAQAYAESGLRTLFYITPIHMDELRSRKPFDEAAFRTSTQMVAAAVSSEGGGCVDVSGLLEESLFIDCFEHYSPRGNLALARALAPEAVRLVSAPRPQRMPERPPAQTHAPIATAPADEPAQLLTN